LDVTQRHPGIQRRGDERMPQRVRGDGLGDPGPARDLADDPPGAVPVQPPPVSGQEEGPVGAPSPLNRLRPAVVHLMTRSAAVTGHYQNNGSWSGR